MSVALFDAGTPGSAAAGWRHPDNLGRLAAAGILGTEYAARRDAAIAAARRNNASLWFAGAPADLAGFVWEDSAGTIPATGTAVIGRLTDRAGSNAATQGATAAKPTLELQANGYYGMRFDGTSDLLSFTGIAPTEDVSVIAATTSNPAAGTIIHMSSGGPQLYFGTPQIRLARSDVANFLVGSFPAAPAVYSAVIDSRVGFLRANGSVLSGPTATPSDFTGAAIGTIGAKTGGSEFLSSAIMLCCASANAMPDADRIAIERFAALLSGATYA